MTASSADPSDHGADRKAVGDERKSFGASVEARVSLRLEAEGWTIQARNWRCRRGELDIVARDGAWLVVVEVRARRGRHYGTPEESVDRRKLERLAVLAQTYVLAVGWDGPWRIDVVAVNVGPDGEPVRWAHYRSAMGPL